MLSYMLEGLNKPVIFTGMESVEFGRTLSGVSRLTEIELAGWETLIHFKPIDRFGMRPICASRGRWNMAAT